MTGEPKEEFRQLLLEAVSRDNILPLTSSCNLRCLFCSHRQLPAEVDVYTFPPLPEEDLEQLIPFLDQKSKIIIGESSTRLCEGEPFTHPSVLPLLYSLRKHFPRIPLQITTNGTLLDEKTVMALQKLNGETPQGEPLLELVISLNCSTDVARAEILGDREPQRAIAALEHCLTYDISFHGSVVAVPHLSGWDDLEKTLLLLDAKGARTIRLFLPGYTRFTPNRQRGDDSLWNEIVLFRERLQGRLRCPVLLEPPLKKDLTARVEGVIGGTPAARAGLRQGDVISAVNGENVSSGVAAFHSIKKAARPLLTVLRPADSAHTPLASPVSAAATECRLRLEKGKGASPGLVIARDLAEETMTLVAKTIGRRKARSPLLLTSRAAAPLWEAALRRGIIPSQTRISIVPNRFFGGTICCAGLLTVSDLREHLNTPAQGVEPDLLLVPGAPFDRRGRDLRGESYRELFHAFPGLCFEVLTS
ncbi:MAG: DUF512 domain-containing protein [Bacillota bacterium]